MPIWGDANLALAFLCINMALTRGIHCMKSAIFVLAMALATVGSAKAEIVEFSYRTAGGAGYGGVNNAPFGNTTAARYQQIYSASGFDSGPIAISDIAFQNYGIGYLPTDYTRMTIALSTSRSIVGGLSNSFAMNTGEDAMVVFDSAVHIDTTGQTLGDFNLIFPFYNQFHYNPSLGNLLVDIMIYDSKGSGAPAFASYNTGASSRLWSFLPDYSHGNADNYSLNTQFFVIPAVPEPVTWAMMVIGFGLVGGNMRRRATSKSPLSA